MNLMLGGTPWPEGGRFRGDMDWLRFAWGFTGLVALAVVASFLAPLLFHANALNGFLVAIAAIFLFASARAPRGYSFLVVRNVWILAWFASDRAVRWTLLALAIAALAVVALQ